MLSQYGFQMFNDQFSSRTNLMSLQYKITAGNTWSPLPQSFGAAVLQVVPGTGLTAQTQVDNFLSSTSEFNYLALDATSVPTDSIGGLIKMSGANPGIVATSTGSTTVGQVSSVQAMVVSLWSGSNQATFSTTSATSSTTMTNTSALTQVSVGTYGDICFKAVMASGFSALTSGMFQIDIYWISI